MFEKKNKKNNGGWGSGYTPSPAGHNKVKLADIQSGKVLVTWESEISGNKFTAADNPQAFFYENDTRPSDIPPQYCSERTTTPSGVIKFSPRGSQEINELIEPIKSSSESVVADTNTQHNTPAPSSSNGIGRVGYAVMFTLTGLAGGLFLKSCEDKGNNSVQITSEASSLQTAFAPAVDGASDSSDLAQKQPQQLANIQRQYAAMKNGLG